MICKTRPKPNLKCFWTYFCMNFTRRAASLCFYEIYSEHSERGLLIFLYDDYCSGRKDIRRGGRRFQWVDTTLEDLSVRQRDAQIHYETEESLKMASVKWTERAHASRLWFRPQRNYMPIYKITSGVSILMPPLRSRVATPFPQSSISCFMKVDWLKTLNPWLLLMIKKTR